MENESFQRTQVKKCEVISDGWFDAAKQVLMIFFYKPYHCLILDVSKKSSYQILDQLYFQKKLD